MSYPGNCLQWADEMPAHSFPRFKVSYMQRTSYGVVSCNFRTRYGAERFARLLEIKYSDQVCGYTIRELWPDGAFGSYRVHSVVAHKKWAELPKK